MAFCLCASSSATAADEPEVKQQPSKVPMAPSPTTVYIVYYSTYGHIRTLAQVRVCVRVRASARVHASARMRAR